MKRHAQRLYRYKHFAGGVLLVLLVAVFYLLSAQVIAWRPVGAHVPVNQPAKLLPCAAPDAKYCSLVRRLVPAVEAGDFSLLLASQAATTVACPNPAAGAYCGAAGVSLSLFPVYQMNQERLLMRNDYIAFLRSYQARTGKFIYQAPSSGVENPLLFHNPQGAMSLKLQLQQAPDGSWQFLWPITVN